MTDSNATRHVHLVGSVPLAGSREVFEALGRSLGTLAPRLPDGETGDRKHWLAFQGGIIGATPNVHETSSFQLHGITMVRYGVVDPERPVTFGTLRYAAEAKASYLEFSALKAEGRIPSATRFQVSLPTPAAVMASFIETAFQERIEPAYEARLLEEVREIAAAVPHDELAIQWDVAFEVVQLAGGSTGPGYFKPVKNDMLEKLVRLGNAIPADIQLGFHLCYGDPGHKHLIEPTDLGLCVEIANRLTDEVGRSIDWIHVPVPKERHDDAYFAPLSELNSSEDTEIFLGLVHLTDGIEGALRRIATAKKYRAAFGIATECGFGRRPPATVAELLELHRTIAIAIE